jgi:hypothetical protein
MNGNVGNQFGQCSRTIGMICSGSRHQAQAPTPITSAVIAHIYSQDHNHKAKYSYLELDSHVDIACVGADCHIIAYTEKKCAVTPYHPEFQSTKDVLIVQAAQHMQTWTYILIINQALYMRESLPSSYFNPSQIRHHGIEVDDVPRHLAPDPEKATHSIYSSQHCLCTILQMKGIISCLPIHYHSTNELEMCERIELKSSED